MFSRILRQLVESVPGARGAIFCDEEGEAVETFGISGEKARNAREIDDFDLKVAGAQLAEPLDVARAMAAELLGRPLELCIRGKNETLLLHTLPDGYYLVLCLSPRALTGIGQEQLKLAASRVIREM